ncbi:dienelactone hydrolase family protein [Marinivivus vitaminiproducens]|uniref:dienelactone hydrolase family protein n=1 Tax=Marinivivus vitaminiproducens TaxID=3035935 RepID=UPI0027A300F2|nr:dienelactone hydrolase family protein [Geminicoccaceae bacterium SCSIO 64248]
MPPIRQDIIKLYDEYTHLSLDRRVFMDRLAQLAGGTAAAAALLPILKANYAKAAVVPPDDPRLRIERVVFPGASGEVRGVLARPSADEGPWPGVLVIHENRGLNPHIEDVTRRMALEGYLALGVDFLSPKGGTPADEDHARELIGELDPETTTADAVAAAAYLRQHADGTGTTGAVGFCWGGGMVGNLAVADPELDAAIVFYGRQPDPADVPRIKARLLLNYAGLDERINAGIPAFEAALDQAGVPYEMHVYDGVNHAFMNDTSEARYDETAAKLAWQRTVEFFTETLAS